MAAERHELPERTVKKLNVIGETRAAAQLVDQILLKDKSSLKSGFNQPSSFFLP